MFDGEGVFINFPRRAYILPRKDPFTLLAN